MDRLITWLARQPIPAYVVGGWVRDRLLGRPLYDLDVVVAGDGLALARRLANQFGGAYYPLDEVRGTGRAILYEAEQRLLVDIASFRNPGSTADLAAALAGDLAERDFTVNALAVDVRAPRQVIDHHHGQADLAARLIRPVTDQSIRSDPIRALRAVRLAATLGFDLAPETEALIRRDGRGLVDVSAERIRDELLRLLALSSAAPSLDQLDALGLLTIFLPELEPLRGLAQPAPHCRDALSHSLETVRVLESLLNWPSQSHAQQKESSGLAQVALPRELVPFSVRLHAHLAEVLADARPRLITLKLAALLHDVGKATAHTVETGPDGERIRFLGHDAYGASIVGARLRRLRLTTAEARLAETIVRHHMRPLLLVQQRRVSSRAVYRFFRDTRSAGVDVLLHALADQRATYAVGTTGEPWPHLVALTARMWSDYWESPEERVDPPQLVDGNDVKQALNLPPGPRIGALLEAVREAQVSGDVQTRDEALVFMRCLVGR